jgi:NAD(P)-dependent dehydrogenase (short-subunit alcohol dehydrogenase family)
VIANPDDSNAQDPGVGVKTYLNMIVICRLAEAVEIANAAAFLGSDQSSSVTGANLMAHGDVGQV